MRFGLARIAVNRLSSGRLSTCLRLRPSRPPPQPKPWMASRHTFRVSSENSFSCALIHSIRMASAWCRLAGSEANSLLIESCIASRAALTSGPPSNQDLGAVSWLAHSLSNRPLRLSSANFAVSTMKPAAGSTYGRAQQPWRPCAGTGRSAPAAARAPDPGPAGSRRCRCAPPASTAHRKRRGALRISAAPRRPPLPGSWPGLPGRQMRGRRDAAQSRASM